MKKRKGMSKKVVIILVIIAIVLASFAVAYHYFDLGKRVSTESKSNLVSSSGGQVGVEILPPAIEDKGIG